MKNPGGYELYEGLTVKWISGRKPELLILDPSDGAVLDRIELSPFKTPELHELVQKRGFRRKAVGADEL